MRWQASLRPSTDPLSPLSKRCSESPIGGGVGLPGLDLRQLTRIDAFPGRRSKDNEAHGPLPHLSPGDVGGSGLWSRSGTLAPESASCVKATIFFDGQETLRRRDGITDEFDLEDF